MEKLNKQERSEIIESIAHYAKDRMREEGLDDCHAYRSGKHMIAKGEGVVDSCKIEVSADEFGRAMLTHDGYTVKAENVRYVAGGKSNDEAVIEIVESALHG